VNSVTCWSAAPDPVGAAGRERLVNAPRRVRVTSPRTSAARTRRTVPTAEIDHRTRLGEVYLSSFLGAQLRLALGVLAVVGGTVVLLPLLFRLLPDLNHVRLLAMPLPWLLLAFAVYPFLLGCAWFYVHRAEHNERLFAAMVTRDADPEQEPERRP
jgi:hypothetical protein